MIRHLVFRCPACRATTSVAAEFEGGLSAEVACSNCNAGFRLDGGRDRASSDAAYYEKVRRFAVESNIDLASAFSVVEGIMAREKVRTLAPTSPEIPRRATASIRPVVLLALLILASGVLARQVRVAWSDPAPGSPSTTDGAAAVSVGLEPRPEPTASAERIRVVPVAYQVDSDGRLTRVGAPDPRSALFGLCQHELHVGVLQPLAIAPSIPANSGQRIGVVRDAGQPTMMAWVRITLDPRTHRWNIGDGQSPVEVESRDDLPPGAEILSF